MNPFFKDRDGSFTSCKSGSWNFCSINTLYSDLSNKNIFSLVSSIVMCKDLKNCFLFEIASEICIKSNAKGRWLGCFEILNSLTLTPEIIPTLASIMQSKIPPKETRCDVWCFNLFFSNRCGDSKKIFGYLTKTIVLKKLFTFQKVLIIQQIFFSPDLYIFQYLCKQILE